jgi:hypothetical protein
MITKFNLFIKESVDELKIIEDEYNNSPTASENIVTKFYNYNLITESPDNIFLDYKTLKYTDNDAVPFGWNIINNKLSVYTGRNGSLHEESMPHIKFSGRLWLDSKIISFWSYPDEKLFIELIKKLEYELKIKIFYNNWKIQIFNKDGIIQKTNKPDDAYLTHKGIKQLIPIEEYVSSDALPEEEKAMHLMNWKEKEKLKPNGFGSNKTAWDSENNIQKRQMKYTSESHDFTI